MKKLVAIIASLFLGSNAVAQTYTQMQWGMNKGVTPYAFGANINGTWSDLGTVNSVGNWILNPRQMYIRPSLLPGAYFASGNHGLTVSPAAPNNDFTSLYAYGGGTNNTALIENDALDGWGMPALTASIRTKNNSNSGAPAGIYAFAFNDRNVAPLSPAWAIYEELRRYSGAGISTAHELNITEFGTPFATDPYGAAYAIKNLSAGLYIQSGGACIASSKCYNPATGVKDLTAVPASVALAIGNNGASFYTGLQFNYNALFGNDGVTDGQFATAIKMPRNDAVSWYYCDNTASYPGNCTANTLGAFIWSDVKSAASVQKMYFSDAAGFLLRNASNANLFNVAVNSSYVNGLQILPSNTGGGVGLNAIGSDTNIGINIVPKGTGTVAITRLSVPQTATFNSIGVANLAVSAAAPTISSGFGTSPSVTANNGTAAFRINVGTGGLATNGVVGLPTAANGWNCFASDITRPATGHTIKQSAGTTTSVTLTNYNNTGTATAWAASDIIIVNCMAY
jgi:hypothetical protein